jgi:hypothetical protein
MSSTQPPRWRRGLATLTAAAVALLGGVAGVAAPAQAADGDPTRNVKVTATGFDHDTFPAPANDSGSAANGVYVAAFDKDADLSKVTMENMDETVAGNAAWVTKAKVGNGDFSTTLSEVPSADEFQVVTWVAHGNITTDTILSTSLLPAGDTSLSIKMGDQLPEEAPEPEFAPETSATVAAASEAEGLSVKVDGSGYENIPAASTGKDAMGVYAAIIDRDLKVGSEEIGADAMAGTEWVNSFTDLKDGKFSKTVTAATNALSKDKNYDVITFVAHGNLTEDTLIYRAPIELTADQKEALFPTPAIEAGDVTVDGIAESGETLTASTSGWTEGASFTYQWLRDGKAIEGATAKTYKLTDADAGTNVAVKVTGSKDGFTPADKTSEAVAVAELETTEPETPEFKGTVKLTPSEDGDDFKVKVDAKDFDHDSFPAPANDSGKPADGVYIAVFKPGTDLSKVTMDNMDQYTLGEALWVTKKQVGDGNFSKTVYGIPAEYAGKDVQVVTWVAHGNINNDVILTNDEVTMPGESTPEEPTKDKTVKVTGKAFDKSKFPAPANDSGKPANGVYVAAFDKDTDLSKVTMENMEEYVAGNASWVTGSKIDDNGNFSTTLSEVPGDSDYRVVVWVAHGNINDDVILADVTLSKADKALEITWDGTNAVEKDPVETGEVEIGVPATVKVGQILNARVGDGWTDGVKFTYQWLRDGEPIKGATKKTYKVTKADAGTALSVEVTGSKADMTARSEVSDPVAVEELDENEDKDATNYKTDDAVLTWGVKESFRKYMSNLPVHKDGKTVVSGGAKQPTKNGVLQFPKGTGVIDQDGKGTISFRGKVHFTGHAGEMDLTMSNLKVKFLSGTTAQLIMDAKVPASETMDTAAFDKKDVVFANLTFPAENYTVANVPLAGKSAAAQKALVLNAAKATLTEDGNKAMGGFYEAGESMDEVSINAKVTATKDDPTGGGSGKDDNDGSGSNTGTGNKDKNKDDAAKHCEPVVSTKDGRTVTSTAFKDGKDYKVELKGSGFVNDKLPQPLNDSGKPADGVYAAVVKKNADLSKITMDNMDSTTLGNAIWITKTQLGSKGEFTNSVRGIPSNAGDEVRVITWVAHGNIGKDVITSDQVVKLDCATAGGSTNTGAANNGTGADGSGNNGAGTTSGSVTSGQAAAAQQCRVVYVSDGSKAPASDSSESSSAASAPQAVAPAAGSGSGSAASGSATLNWGVKASFLSYIKGGIAKGDISTSGGAQQTGDGLTWGTGSGSLANGGTVTFPGSVHFTGHKGILDTTFSNLRVKSTGSGKASLILNSKSQDMEGKDASQSNVTFATITFSGDGSQGISNGKVSLTADGAKAFAGFYSAGQALDSMNLTLSGSSAGATGGATNPVSLFAAVQQMSIAAVSKDESTSTTKTASTTPVESGITVDASANASDYDAAAPEGMKATIVCGDKVASTGADNANLIGAGALLALLGAAGVVFAARRKTNAKN